MATPTKVQEYGNQMLVIMSDGSRHLAYPTTGGLWLIVGASGGGGGFAWPFSYEFSSNPANGYPDDWFHTPGRPTHNGGDFGYGNALNGATVGCAGPGTIIESRNDAHEDPGSGSFGNYALVEHGDIGGNTYQTLYAHMQFGTVLPTSTAVSKGTTLGLVGNTGGSFGAHLHFETHQNGTPIDPLVWMSILNPSNESIMP